MDASQSMTRELSDRWTPRLSKTELKYLENDRAVLHELLKKAGNGSILRGWRRAFDPDGMLEIDFQDYLKAAARLNFYGDAQYLFGVDSNFDTMTLAECDPVLGKVVQEFIGWVHESFGGPQQMFRAFDESGSGKLTFEAFCSACKAHECPVAPEDLRPVYDCCDVSDVGFIMLDDVIFLEMDPIVRSKEIYNSKVGHVRQWKRMAALEYLESQKVPLDDPAELKRSSNKLRRCEPRPWLSQHFEAMPIVMNHLRQVRNNTSQRKARHARIAFTKHLTKTYGHGVRALRRDLDPDQTYSFTQRTLRRYCRAHDLNVSVPDLWLALDGDTDGFVRLEDLCPQEASVLGAFQKWAFQEPILGTCAAIWESEEAANVSRKRTGTWFAGKKMQFKTFTDTLRDLGWPGARNRKIQATLCKTLDLHGAGVIGRADLEWLDKWRPHEWVYVEPDPRAWKALKEKLVHLYGHPLRAWRALLDEDDSNKLSWHEFKSACKKIKFPAYAAAWRAIDIDMSGAISMKEYDPESFEILHSFKEWVDVNFGSVKQCFKALDADRSNSISYPELKRACHKLHWNGDVRLLFNCLDIERSTEGGMLESRRVILLSELSFLDSWQCELSETELAEEDAVAIPKSPPAGSRAQVRNLIDRLTRQPGQHPDEDELPKERSSMTTVSTAETSCLWSRASSPRSMTKWSSRPYKGPLAMLCRDLPLPHVGGVRSASNGGFGRSPSVTPSSLRPPSSHSMLPRMNPRVKSLPTLCVTDVSLPSVEVSRRWGQ